MNNTKEQLHLNGIELAKVIGAKLTEHLLTLRFAKVSILHLKPVVRVNASISSYPYEDDMKIEIDHTFEIETAEPPEGAEVQIGEVKMEFEVAFPDKERELAGLKVPGVHETSDGDVADWAPGDGFGGE